MFKTEESQKCLVSHCHQKARRIIKLYYRLTVPDGRFLISPLMSNEISSLSLKGNHFHFLHFKRENMLKHVSQICPRVPNIYKPKKGHFSPVYHPRTVLAVCFLASQAASVSVLTCIWWFAKWHIKNSCTAGVHPQPIHCNHYVIIGSRTN